MNLFLSLALTIVCQELLLRLLQSPMLYARDASAPTYNARKDRGRFFVIGAGGARSGTESMALAMEQLGHSTLHFLGDVYRIDNLHAHLQTWANAHRRGKMTYAECALIFRHYSASFDAPTAALFNSIMRCFPNSRVILTRRPSGGKKRSLPMFFGVDPRAVYIAWRTLLWPFCFGQSSIAGCLFTRIADKAFALPDDWESHVRATVPSHRLLTYSVTEGWPPLCAFLDVAQCPRTPFPHAHNSSQAGLGFAGSPSGEVLLIVMLNAQLVILLLTPACFCCCVYCRRRRNDGKAANKDA